MMTGMKILNFRENSLNQKNYEATMADDVENCMKISIRNFECVSIQAEQFFFSAYFSEQLSNFGWQKYHQSQKLFKCEAFRFEFIDYIYFIIWSEKLFKNYFFSGFSSCIQHCYKTNKQKEKETNESEHKTK